MAIIDSTIWATHTGVTVTGADAVSIAAYCAGVDAAIKRMLRPFHPEPTTITDCILDAPPDRDLVLPVVPVRAVTSVYVRPDANGLVANFTSDYLLDNTDNAEYQLLIDDFITGYARRGILRRVNRLWGYGHYSPPDRLAYKLEPRRGAIKVTFTAGPASVPTDIQLAATIAVTLMYNRRVEGAPYASESWNGRSQSIAGPFTAESAVRTPDVLALLTPYLTVHVG
jgi:hypothetical protein